MNAPDNEKVTEVQNSNSPSRRKFLLKTSAGVVITTLPVQSVWGACNASGLSGGSRSADSVCVMPIVTGGRSPGSWRKFAKSGEPDKVGLNKVKSMFSMSKNDDLTAAYCSVRSHIKNMPDVVLSDGSGTIPRNSLNIYEALQSQGGIWNLAAYYLNAYFGFYGDISPFTSAEELVQHVWGVMYINNDGQLPSNYDDLTASFTDGFVAESNLPHGSC